MHDAVPVTGPLGARLTAEDARIDAACERRTLAPDRARATSLAALMPALANRGFSPTLLDAVGAGLVTLTESMRRAFPENIYWDVDHLAYAVAREAARTADPPAHAERALGVAASLQDLFGGASAIRFRYVHDFAYGFDWAKWVRKDPASRAAVGPFDLAFLERMARRGEELLALIADDDPEYPRLRHDAPRNPFGFSREPDAEARLFADLAAHDLIPVRAWELETTPTWDRDFKALRAQRARRITS